MSGWEGVSHCISRRLPISPVQLSAVNERGAGPHSEVVEGWTLPDTPGAVCCQQLLVLLGNMPAFALSVQVLLVSLAPNKSRAERL